MRKESLSIKATGRFSDLLSSYVNEDPKFSPFIKAFPTKENLLNELDSYEINRSVLVSALREQYADLEITSAVSENIEALSDNNCFTVCTGHQLSFATGPLFFIYKIASAIQLAKQLTNQGNGHKVIPVFWMATEDHDFDEINHFNLFGRKFEWEHPEGNSNATGRLVLEDMSNFFSELPEEIELLKKHYTAGSTLASATRSLVNELFGNYGLVIIDADNPRLKAEVITPFRKELTEGIGEREVLKANNELLAIGCEGQAFARPINLFYLKDGKRNRIEKEAGVYRVLSQELEFSEAEILDELQAHPERFSPNVILRPVYQQVILPNIAYIGGPAEVAYWLQLKGVFEQLEVRYPIVMPRAFNLVLSKNLEKKKAKLGLETRDLFKSQVDLKNQLIDAEGEEKVSLATQFSSFESLMSEIKAIASPIDPGMGQAISAEESRILKQLEKLEKRIQKAQEGKHSQVLQQLDQLLNKLFPGGSLQERNENFLSYFLNNPNFINEVVESCDPLDFQFHVLSNE